MLEITSMPAYPGGVVINELTEIYTTKNGYNELKINDNIEGPYTLIANAIYSNNECDHDCCVKAGYEDVADENGESVGDAFYIYSGEIYNDEIHKKSINGEFLKYQYTKEELGMDDKETVEKMCFGANNYCGYNDLCLLAIVTFKEIKDTETYYERKIHFYPYDINKSRILYKNDDYIGIISTHIVYQVANDEVIKAICSSKYSPYVFAYYSKNKLTLLELDHSSHSQIAKSFIDLNIKITDVICFLSFEVGDTLLVFNFSRPGNPDRNNTYIQFIGKNEDDNSYYFQNGISYHAKDYCSTGISDNGKFLVAVKPGSYNIPVNLYKVNINYLNYTIETELLKEISFDELGGIAPYNTMGDTVAVNIIVSNDGKHIFLFSENKKCCEVVFNFENFDSSTIKLLDNNTSKMFSNCDNSKVYISNGDISSQLEVKSYTIKETDKLIGLKYKNDVFYTVNAAYQEGEIVEKQVGGGNM